MKVISESEVAQSCQTVATPWTAAYQAPLNMEFPRQEYWSEWPFPPPWDLPGPGVEPTPPVSPASAGEFFTTEPLLLLLLSHFSRVRLCVTP